MRRARWAVTAAFATNGALLGALIPHYPGAKAAFGLDPAAFGLLVIALAVGGTLAGPLPAPLLRRFGARRVMLAGSLLIALLTTAAGVVLDVAGGAGSSAAESSPTAALLWVFAGLVLASGTLDAVVDTAQNAQGLRVQTRLARPVLTTMHAGWSLGAAAGAGLGAVGIAAGWPVALHLGLNGAACVAVLVVVRRMFLPDARAGRSVEAPGEGAGADSGTGPAGVEPGTGDSAGPVAGDVGAPATENATAPGAGSAAASSSGRSWIPPRAALAALVPAVVIAMAGFGVEEFGNAWTALFLITERGLDPAAAALGASTLLGAQFVGRLVGDRTIAALGRRRALTAGLGAVVVGLGLTLAPWPEPAAVPAAFTGLALAGLGCAVVVPVAYALGDEAPGLRPQTGLAVTSWCMRLAGVGLSPAVGALAGAFGLTPALTVFLALAAVGAVLAARLPPGGAPRDRVMA